MDTAIEGHYSTVWISATFDDGQQCSLWSYCCGLQCLPVAHHVLFKKPCPSILHQVRPYRTDIMLLAALICVFQSDYFFSYRNPAGNRHRRRNYRQSRISSGCPPSYLMLGQDQSAITSDRWIPVTTAFRLSCCQQWTCIAVCRPPPAISLWAGRYPWTPRWFPPRSGSEQHDQFCKSAALSRMFKKRRRPHNPAGRACFRILVSGSHAPSELSGVYFGVVYNVL